MDDAQPGAFGMVAVHLRAGDLARRIVWYHRVHEAEHRSRERFGRRFTPFPWREAADSVLADEPLEDEATVVALIRELGRQGCSEVALAALDLVLTRGTPGPSKAMFDAAIGVCAAEYQDQRCLEQYDRMLSLGLQPDIGTANLVLTGLCCRGQLARAVQLLGEVRNQMGIRPNSYSVLMVLQACNYKRKGAYREAIDAVQALEAGGRTANEEVIEALLQVCEAAMQRAPSFEAALAVFHALAELHLADSTRVYNGLLGAAGRAGRWREAQALYAQMREDDVPASLETHTALIQACVVGRALDHALDIFEHLVAGRSAHEAVPASIATYNHLIHACHQAGMLEKALEIASWVQKTGVEFDDETYGELMATIDVAQLWDDKAMKQARQRHKAVLPRHLRPAPYDAMRVMYLDHLESLQQEELLALEKLGGIGSWAPKSLTRGPTGGPAAPRGSPTPGIASSVNSSARSLARAVPSALNIGPFKAAWGAAIASGGGGAMYDPSESVYVAAAASPPPPSLLFPAHGREPAAAAAASSSSSEVAAMTATAVAATGMRSSMSSPLVPPSPVVAAAAEGGDMSRSRGSSRSPSPQPGTAAAAARAASVQQLLRSLSTRPLPALGGGGGGASFRSPASGAPPPPAAATGFYEPPTWAQVQTMDAATAGPGGTPFSAAVAAAAASGGAGLWVGGGPDGAAAGVTTENGVMSLTLALEPANLYGQASGASLGGSAAGRASIRNITIGIGAGGGGVGVWAPALPSPTGAGPGGGALPPLGEPVSPSGARPGTSGGVNGSHGPVAGSHGPVASLPFGRPRTRKTAAAAASAGGAEHGHGAPAAGLLAGVAGASEYLTSPLPYIATSASAAGGNSRRLSSLAPQAAVLGSGAKAAASAGF